MREGGYKVIREEFGVSYHPAHVSRLVRASGLSLQKPQRRANQRDEEAIERWKKEFEEAADTFRKVCINRLFPYQSDKELQDHFYRAFDGMEVIPASLERRYRELKDENPLLAGELPVTITWGQFKSAERKGFVRQFDDCIKLVDLPYDEEFGLRLDAGDARA